MPAKYLAPGVIPIFRAFLILFVCTVWGSPVCLDIQPISFTHYQVRLEFDIDPCDGIYEQYFLITVDDPAITLSKFSCSNPPTSHYIAAFKENKMVYMGPCIFTGTLYAPSPEHLSHAHLYVTWQRMYEKHSKTMTFPLYTSMPAPLSSCVDTSSSVIPLDLNKEPFFLGNPIPDVQPPVLPSESPPAHGLPAMFFFTLGSFLIGMYLLYKGTYTRCRRMPLLIANMGMALIACSIVLGAKTYQMWYKNKQEKLPIEKNLMPR